MKDFNNDAYGIWAQNIASLKKKKKKGTNCKAK